jgi:ElaB/YqjD/DUF883 family membrane-anchored ribosome-binding protein
MAKKMSDDDRRNKAHSRFMKMTGEIEQIIDDLKSAGPDEYEKAHGHESNALANVREWLVQLSKR